MVTRPGHDAMDSGTPAKRGASDLFNLLAFAVFTGLWVAFGAALLLSRGTLDDAWRWMRDLPLILEGLIWLLFFPITLGLAIWQTDWSFWLRVLLIVGLATANIAGFYPRASQPGHPQGDLLDL